MSNYVDVPIDLDDIDTDVLVDYLEELELWPNKPADSEISIINIDRTTYTSNGFTKMNEEDIVNFFIGYIVDRLYISKEDIKKYLK
jgi:hypothetical protein